jgi:dihydrofolate reductase
MRKLIVTEFLTLDGVMEDPHKWSFPYWNDAISDFKYAETFACDALLLGRVTYEGFAAAWPSRTDETGFADRFNSIPKYVASTTLKKLDWNNSHLLKGDFAKEVAKLKNQPGQDIVIDGSAKLVQTLMPHNLIDQYQLLVYPIVLGKGKRLFSESNNAKLKLAESKPMGSGVVLISYEPQER